MSEQRSGAFNKAARRVLVIALCAAALGVTTPGAQSDEASSHQGGDVTIITGARKDTAPVRSTRFR
jgi:hypothetical protein